MEFDWTTFVLEIINFLVLVWILQRFLYKPVANAIARRKAEIDKSLADARAAQAEAEALKHQYENRLADWNQEKEKARAQLLEELDAERIRSLTTLQVSLEKEREKSRVLEQRRAVEQRRSLEQDALATGARFVARLLSRIACAELEGTIRQAMLEDLAHLPEQELQGLRTPGSRAGSKVRIASAYPMGQEEQDAWAQALGRLTSGEVACEFRQDPALIAGLRVSLGPWVLHANVQDELKFFAEAARHGRQ
jgi:F-type H+-transporting ATPase subunit b